jgi:hypothetical protein
MRDNNSQVVKKAVNRAQLRAAQVNFILDDDLYSIDREPMLYVDVNLGNSGT